MDPRGAAEPVNPPTTDPRPADEEAGCQVREPSSTSAPQAAPRRGPRDTSPAAARPPTPVDRPPAGLPGLQALAGNTAVAGLLRPGGPRGTNGTGAATGPRGPVTVARWTGPISLQSQESLLEEARKGSGNAIIQLEEKTLAGATDDERLRFIDDVNTSFAVVLRSSRALERIWRSFGDRFQAVASAHLERWHLSCVRHSGLPDNVPAARNIQDAWVRDIRAAGDRYLDTNQQFALDRLKDFGAGEAESAEPQGAPTDEQASTLSKLQTAAEGLAALRWGQQASRDTYVGYVDVLPPAGSMEDAHHYRRVKFDPEGPAPITTITRDPARPAYLYDELRETEVPLADGADPNTLAPVTPYQDVRNAYAQAEIAATATLAIFPELFALSDGQPGPATGQFAATRNASAARQQLVAGMRGLLGHIRSARPQLAPGGGLDPLDLTPIHKKLTTGGEKAASGTDWSQPFALDVATTMVRGHDVDRALRRLVLQQLAELAFLIAPVAGGLAALDVLTAGAVLTGTNVVWDANRYTALANAAATGARPGTTMVDRKSVDEAKMAAESETLALALAAFALGAAAAAAGLRAWRAGRVPPGERPPPPANNQPPPAAGTPEQPNAPRPGGTPEPNTTPRPATPPTPPDPAAAAAAAQAQAVRVAFAAEIEMDAGLLAGFSEEEVNRLRRLLPDTHPMRVTGMRNYLTEQVGRGRHSRKILGTLDELEPRERRRFLTERATSRWNPDWRGRDPSPTLDNGNLDEGWAHIEARHVIPSPAASDLFAPGTTRQQILKAATDVIERGRRVSARGQRITTFEDSMYVNGQRDAIRVTVDTADGRIITVFPVRGGGP